MSSVSLVICGHLVYMSVCAAVIEISVVLKAPLPRKITLSSEFKGGGFRLLDAVGKG